jgi:hypothetical protein
VIIRKSEYYIVTEEMFASLSILYLLYLVFIFTSNFKILGGFHIFGHFLLQKNNLIKHAAEIKNTKYELYALKDDDQNDYFYAAGSRCSLVLYVFY